MVSMMHRCLFVIVLTLAGNMAAQEVPTPTAADFSREKLIQLVGIVVDSGDQISCLVLIEERQRQLLQLGEDRIPQLEQYGSPDSSHPLRLKVTGEKSADVDGQQQRCRR